jgi:hypothetical protein
VSSLRFALHAASVLAPGLASLGELREACRRGGPLAATAPLVLPAPAALPANERRRASQVVRLALACIDQALQSSPFGVETLRSVFATDEGTGEVCDQMLEVIATNRQVSPLLFPNTVQNAASGYFSIAWRNHQPATVASLGLESFASGLLCAVTEAAATGQPVLLVAYDAAMNGPMRELLPITQPTATAWILSAAPAFAHVPVLGSFALDLEPRGTTPPSAMPSWLPQAWSEHSSARALAALGLLESAGGTAFRMTLGGQLLSIRRVEVALS